MPRPDWLRPLPRPLTIPDVKLFETLADVRVLVEKHLPAEYRSKFTWRQPAGLLKRAAEGQQDVAEVSTALRMYCSSKASSVCKALPAALGYRRAQPELLYRPRQ